MYRLFVAKPAGFALEAPNVGSQLLKLGHEIGFHNGRASKEDQIKLTVEDYCRHRIPIARNLAVKAARNYGATHLMMMDPDICIDWYLGKQSWALPWWKTFWARAKDEVGVFAAPYAGARNLIQVFEGGTTPEGRRRVEWNDAAIRTGWQRVSAVGTGLLLIPMAVFDRIDQYGRTPYFDDDEKDWRKTELSYTPDIWFCERCAEADVPVWVNWDCWCGHWQNQIVEGPRRELSLCRTAECSA